MALQQSMSQIRGLQQAIEGGALDKIAEVLESGDVCAREKAALCLAAYTVNLAEKSAAALHGVLGPVLRLLQDESLAVRTAAASALMSITVHNDCKTGAVQLSAVKEMAPLLDESVLHELQG